MLDILWPVDQVLEEKLGNRLLLFTASWFLKSSGKIRYMESKAVLAKGSEEVKTKSRDAFYNNLSEQKKKKKDCGRR